MLNLPTKKQEFETQYAKARADIDARESANLQYQDQLAKLQLARDGAEESLARIEDHRNLFTARLEQLKSLATSLWPQSRNDIIGYSSDPLISLVETHTTILALEDALCDFPAVKQQLSRDLDAANETLAAFIKRAPK